MRATPSARVGGAARRGHRARLCCSRSVCSPLVNLVHGPASPPCARHTSCGRRARTPVCLPAIW
eukprot:734202-Heterocapsa_arctica.AAC.1